MIRLIVPLLFICTVYYTVSADFCSEEKGMENFNSTALEGVWYFSYMYGTRISISFGDGCQRSHHTVTDNGFHVLLDFYKNKKKQSFVADAPLRKQGGSYFQVTPKDQNLDLYTVVLDTDYKNYFTEYFCTHGQMAQGFIRTRSKNPSPEIIKKAKEVAIQRVPNAEPFVDLGCPTSDI